MTEITSLRNKYLIKVEASSTLEEDFGADIRKHNEELGDGWRRAAEKMIKENIVYNGTNS